MPSLSLRAEVQRQRVRGEEGWAIFGGDDCGGHWVALTDAQADELTQVIAPDLVAACHRALPLVRSLCNALGETCDEEAADILGLLERVTRRYAPPVKSERCEVSMIPAGLVENGL